MSNVSRRQTLGLGLAAGFSVTLLSGGREAQAAPAPGTTFSLLLVNDIYKAGDTDGRGGFPKLAAVVKAERARGVPMLFCHAGDSFSPSLMSGFDRGEHIVRLTNMMRPDVFVPGNHEFDFGKDVFLQRMAQADFPFQAANLRQADGSPLPGIAASRIVPLGGVKVGVVGLALAATPHMSQSGDLVFRPELATLRDEVQGLRQAGAEFLVCVAHTDRATDNEIVRSRLVDVLLSGHDHDLAIGYDGRTVMVESSEEGNYVTAVDFTVSVQGADRRLSWRPSFRVHDSTAVTPDPDMQAVVDGLEAELSHQLDVELGTTAVELDSRTASIRSQETAMGDLVADAIRVSTGADCAIVNGGAIRANRLYPPGSRLTRRDILSELPFGNTTVLVELSGSELEAALENGLSQIEHHAGRFPQVSGIALVADPRAPAGHRLLSVDIGGRPLDPAGRYKVGSNNFMLAGGDGYASLAAGRVLVGATDGRLLANEVMAYVRGKATVTTGIEGRIVLKP
ncbi:bifunctional metallophosphatase/5'-nucleotidase [Labrys monachus]|uniref:2',3'-cyclic-nucleotide 2'-phosphodiesterase (5'-nucleotidase family) n=1 Tax=Labrys monachus TaxID=217067 RepID=A0ABU0F826_9HYPH|nr:bifunctional UDP-sugar hydrolase/5'-nucleotidase [Labrys monachus]MDQ0390763.1 2',3'-cyclic-nucleotide 2'-phosphodiesterase (5'-nucleotidase family) [Labrys monachus]